MSADEYREFARMQQLRFERMMRDHAERFERFISEWRADSIRRHEEVMARLEEDRAKTDLMLADHRAQLGALLAVLDRLNGGGAEPAT